MNLFVIVWILGNFWHIELKVVGTSLKGIWVACSLSSDWLELKRILFSHWLKLLCKRKVDRLTEYFVKAYWRIQQRYISVCYLLLSWISLLKTTQAWTTSNIMSWNRDHTFKTYVLLQVKLKFQNIYTLINSSWIDF